MSLHMLCSGWLSMQRNLQSLNKSLLEKENHHQADQKEKDPSAGGLIDPSEVH